MKGIIYKITSPSGKFYIGQTWLGIKKRFNNHKQDSKKGNAIIHKAFQKYGADNMVIEKIDEASSQDELDRLEIKYIAELKPKYNSTTGGLGGKHSALTKMKMQKLQLLRYSNPSEREKRRINLINRYKDPAERNKTRMQTLDRWNNPEKRLILMTARNQPHVKEKLKKTWKNETTRMARIEGIKAAHKRPEVIERYGLAQSKSWKNPDIREARIAGIKAAHKRPEVIEKRRISSKLALEKRKAKALTVPQSALPVPVAEGPPLAAVPFHPQVQASA